MSEALAARVRNISRVIYAAIALLVFVGDQATKAIVESSIPERQIIPVIPGFFNITHVKNEGAAFGLFALGAVAGGLFTRWRMKRTTPTGP